MSRSLWSVVGFVCGVVAVTVLMLVGLAFTHPAPPAVQVSVQAVHRTATWVAYVDPYGSTAPGGAPAPDSSASGVVGLAVGSGVDGLAGVPFQLLGGVVGVLILWGAVSFVWGFFR